MNIREAITRVVSRSDLTETEMYQVMNDIMGGSATPVQIGSFLTGLRMKGETIDEISAAVKVMREKVTPVETGVDMAAGGVVVDTCGTGGDSSGTFNVSTASAFVVAGCGYTVAKHGNRSVSSSCGSADVLEAVGVRLDLAPDQLSNCIKRAGIGFLFAPVLHGAMKYAIGPRREIGIRTIFNILGPMTNPAGANVQVIGVFAEELAEQLARVLAKLGTRRALVVHGEGNLDELTVTGKTIVADMHDGKVSVYEIVPEDVGLPRSDLSALKGGRDVADSARIMREILSGAGGAKRDMVLLNSGAALMAAGAVDDIRGGVDLAAQCIDSGRAVAKLQELVDVSNSY